MHPRRLTEALAIAWMVACGPLAGCEAEPTSRPTPFTGAQLDRIEAGMTATAPVVEPGSAQDLPPLWISQELMDDDTRLVVHIRLPIAGSLQAAAVHQARCGDARERLQSYLLPDQRVEMYLAFDDTIHACRDDG